MLLALQSDSSPISQAILIKGTYADTHSLLNFAFTKQKGVWAHPGPASQGSSASASATQVNTCRTQPTLAFLR